MPPQSAGGTSQRSIRLLSSAEDGPATPELAPPSGSLTAAPWTHTDRRPSRIQASAHTPGCSQQFHDTGHWLHVCVWRTKIPATRKLPRIPVERLCQGKIATQAIKNMLPGSNGTRIAKNH
jgi:hypothetical protein